MKLALRCRWCGRRFADAASKLAIESLFCRRATERGSLCDDRRCIAQRRLHNDVASYCDLPSHSCDENKIKLNEKGTTGFRP